MSELTPRQQQIRDDIDTAKQHYEDGLITEIEMKREIAEIKREAFHSYGTDLPKAE